MSNVDPKKLIEQIRDFIKRWSYAVPDRNVEQYEALDQLSACLAGQEKAARVKVLEEIRAILPEHERDDDTSDEIHGDPPEIKGCSNECLRCTIDQKIEEVRK